MKKLFFIVLTATCGLYICACSNSTPLVEVNKQEAAKPKKLKEQDKKQMELVSPSGSGVIPTAAE